MSKKSPLSLRFVPKRPATTVATIAAVALVAGIGFYSTQPATAAPILQLPRVKFLASVPNLQIAVPTELRQHLISTKVKLAPEVLDKSYFLRGNLPIIKLDNGEEKTLLPLSLMEGATVNTDQIPDDLKDYAPYINNQNLKFSARASIYKINPQFFIPTVVDHRSSMTPIRDQGPRGTCVAHASNAALEVFPSIPDDLSEQYSYNLFMQKEGRQPCDDGGIKTTNSATYLADGTVTEDKWPYTNAIPACNTTIPAAAASATKYKITGFQLIEDGGVNGAASIKNPRYLESVLRAGRNIVLGTHVAWRNSDAPGIIDVVIDSSTGQPAASRGGHAMLICGFDSANRYFIVKNSWGSGWGHSGYAFLSYDYISTYAKYGYYIKTVSPNLIMINPNFLNKAFRILPQN